MAEENADIIINIDQSISITRNLNPIKEFIKDNIFKKIVKSGDTVYLYSFDGKFYIQAVLSGKSSPQEIDDALNKINGGGKYTDLVNSVVSMTGQIENMKNKGKKKIIFFLTDGINDPPADSPYKEGINHEFFKRSKRVLEKGGWLTFVVGIGGKTDADKIAKQLDAVAVQLDETVSVESMENSLAEKLKSARENPVIQTTDEKTADDKQFSLGIFYRQGLCIGLRRPEFNPEVNWGAATTLKSTEDYVQINEAVLQLEYQLNDNYSLIGRFKNMYIQNPAVYDSTRTVYTQDTVWFNQSSSLGDSHDSSFMGFGIQAGILYEITTERSYPYFLFTAGYSKYKFQGDYISTHRDILVDNVPNTNEYRYTLTCAEISHVFSLEFEFGYSFNIYNDISIVPALGVEIPVMAALYNDVQINNTYERDTACINHWYYDKIQQRNNLFEGNFPPVWYIQLGIVYRL